MVLVFSQIGKVCNFKVAGSVVITVLKKLSQLSEKANIAFIRLLLLGAKVDEVSWMMSGYWREYSVFISWIWLKMI